MKMVPCILLCANLMLADLGLAQTNVNLIGRNSGSKILSDGNEIRVFGFAQKFSENPSLPGTKIEVLEGDSVIIDFWNISQGAPHTIHLHGLDVNQANDGVPHLSFEVHHMEHGFYRFKAPHPGTYLYHCHVVSSIHVQAGMYGQLIVRPKSDSNLTWEGGYKYQSEASLFMTEIDTFWHHDSVLLHDYDTSMGHHLVKIPKYEPQHFMVNGHSNQQLDSTDWIVGKPNSNIYVRLTNLGYFGNLVTFPSKLNATIIDSDGRPLENPEFESSVEVYPGERYGVLLQPTEEYTGDVLVEYINMNTGIAENEQSVPVKINGGFVGLQEVETSENMFYPNPTDGIVHFHPSSHLNIKQLQVQVMNELGQVVIDRLMDLNRASSLSFESLPAGLYTIQSMFQNEIITQRLLKL